MASQFNGSHLGDHLAVIKSLNNNGRFMGAYYMNKPPPSGSPRLLLQWSTKLDYKTEQEAATAIEELFPAMPKIKRPTKQHG